jgi:hypothetical protein
MMATVPKISAEIELASLLLRSVGRAAEGAILTEDDATVQFRLPNRPGRKLATVVFGKESLRKLLADPAADVKLEYLKRDLQRAAMERRVFRFPHTLYA